MGLLPFCCRYCTFSFPRKHSVSHMHPADAMTAFQRKSPEAMKNPCGNTVIQLSTLLFICMCVYGTFELRTSSSSCEAFVIGKTRILDRVPSSWLLPAIYLTPTNTHSYYSPLRFASFSPRSCHHKSFRVFPSPFVLVCVASSRMQWKISRGRSYSGKSGSCVLRISFVRGGRFVFVCVCAFCYTVRSMTQIALVLCVAAQAISLFLYDASTFIYC